MTCYTIFERRYGYIVEIINASHQCLIKCVGWGKPCDVAPFAGQGQKSCLFVYLNICRKWQLSTKKPLEKRILPEEDWFPLSYPVN